MIEQTDNRFGLSQDSIEELRAEFISLGGIVDSLPDVGDVRDWTMVGIESKDLSGDLTVNLYLMMLGKWFSLNEYQVEPTGSHGNIDQFDTSSVIAFTGANDITVITENWIVGILHFMDYNNAGVFTCKKAGSYSIGWSLSFASSGNNKDYEMGILVNGVNLQQGWAHRKIGASTDLGDMSSLTIFDLKKGDKISLGMLNETDTQTAIIDHATLVLNRIR